MFHCLSSQLPGMGLRAQEGSLNWAALHRVDREGTSKFVVFLWGFPTSPKQSRDPEFAPANHVVNAVGAHPIFYQQSLIGRILDWVEFQVQIL